MDAPMDNDEMILPQNNYSKPKPKRLYNPKSKKRIEAETERKRPPAISDSDTDTSDTDPNTTIETKQIETKQIKNRDFWTPSIWLMLGRPKQGKTHLIKYFLYHFTIGKSVPKDRRFNWIVVFTGSKFNNEFRDMVEDKNIIEMKPETYRNQLERYINGLKSIVEKKGKCPPSALVFDDVVGLLDTTHDNAFINFITIFRKLNITVFIAVQYLNRNIGSTVRECINHYCIFNSKAHITLKSLYEACGQLFESYEQFKRYFLKITAEKFVAMYYDQNEDDITKNYLALKAPEEIPKVMLKSSKKQDQGPSIQQEDQQFQQSQEFQY